MERIKPDFMKDWLLDYEIVIKTKIEIRVFYEDYYEKVLKNLFQLNKIKTKIKDCEITDGENHFSFKTYVISMKDWNNIKSYFCLDKLSQIRNKKLDSLLSNFS